jgi:hypothetical protein
MRRRLAFALVVAAGAACGSGALAAGCTLLIPFDELDKDGGAETGPPPPIDGDAPPGDAEGGIDTGVAFPPPCDPKFDAGAVTCDPNYPRPECAHEPALFAGYPGDVQNDLVGCSGPTHPTCIQHCPFGCAIMPQGYSDMCDDCHGKPQGTYCVKDLGGGNPDDLSLAVDCDGGKVVKTYACGTGRCASQCPRTDHAPACCN